MQRLCSAVRICAGHADAAAAAMHLAAFAGRSPALAMAARRLVADELRVQEAGNPAQGPLVAAPGPGTRDGIPAQVPPVAARAPAGPGTPAKGAAGAAAAQLQAVLAVALRALGGAETGAPGDALQPAAACRPAAHANGTGPSCSGGQIHVGDPPAAAAALGAAGLPALQGLRDGVDGREGVNCAAEAGQQRASAGDGWGDEGRVWVQGAAAAHLARHVLTAPRLPAMLTRAARVSLASHQNLSACLAALRRLCDPGSDLAHPAANPAPGLAPNTGLGAQGWAGECGGGATQGEYGRGSVARGLVWVDCVWALGNVLALAVGDMTSKCTKACACLCPTWQTWARAKGLLPCSKCTKAMHLSDPAITEERSWGWGCWPASLSAKQGSHVHSFPQCCAPCSPHCRTALPCKQCPGTTGCRMGGRCATCSARRCWTPQSRPALPTRWWPRQLRCFPRRARAHPPPAVLPQMPQV